MSQHQSETSIKSAVDSLQDLLDSQTDTTIQGLVALEEENKVVFQHYASLNEAAEGLKADGVFLQDTRSEITKYVEQLNDVANEVERLEVLVKEMDEWSKELSIKIKRL